MKKRTLSLFILLLATACGRHPHDKQEVLTAMQQYDRLIQEMDADSIALLYAADGDLGGIARGRDSIRRFLSSFKNVKVWEASSSTDSLLMDHDSAILSGHYRQTGVIDGKDTFHVKGTYHANWIRVEGEGWRIKAMSTRPER